MKSAFLFFSLAAIPLLGQAQIIPIAPSPHPEGGYVLFMILGVEAEVGKCSIDYPALAAGISSAFAAMKQRNLSELPQDVWVDDARAKELGASVYKDRPAPTENECKALVDLLSPDQFDARFQALARVVREEAERTRARRQSPPAH